MINLSSRAGCHNIPKSPHYHDIILLPININTEVQPCPYICASVFIFSSSSFDLQPSFPFFLSIHPPLSHTFHPSLPASLSVIALTYTAALYCINQITETRLCSLLYISNKPLRGGSRGCRVTIQFNFVCMTGLLPLLASICVYCPWTEMKRGGVAALRRPGWERRGEETLKNTALQGRACQTHTQGSPQHRPANTPPTPLLPPRQSIVNLQLRLSLLFPHFVILFLTPQKGEGDEFQSVLSELSGPFF